MWLMIMYDFPSISKKEKSDAKKFRKNLIKDGFTMFQFSIYIRYCFNYESVNTHKRRIKKFLTNHGKISIIKLSDKHFNEIEMFKGKNMHKAPKVVMFI